MNSNRHHNLAQRKRRIAHRLRPMRWTIQARPMLTARNIHDDVSGRTRAIDAGGIGAMHLLARDTGLIDAIDQRVQVLKRHLPYHESDHVLSLAYNILSGGTCLQDLEQRRQDETYLDALGAQRIPDPTTAGDFCRRFDAETLDALQAAINETRVRVWRTQPAAFFDEAFLEADGTLAPTTGGCKAGMDIAYDGTWGYHPLLVSLANTAEPLFVVNRSGNRPSYEGAAERFDQAAALCREEGFRRVTLRGDTDFTQTAHLDRWHAGGLRFIFGSDARPNVIKLADALPDAAWTPLARPAPSTVQSAPRKRPVNTKEAVIVERGFRNLRLQAECVAEFAYRPTACARTYRLVVVRKNISVEEGAQRLFDQIRYFFYLTNDTTTPAADIVFLANDRCNQENLIDQLKHGVRAMALPVDTLISNGAYMVMAALAWTLKAWFALRLPVRPGRWAARHAAEQQAVLRMEFKAFRDAFIRVPTQIVRTSRRIVFRLLSWNPWLHVLLRAADPVRGPAPC